MVKSESAGIDLLANLAAITNSPGAGGFRQLRALMKAKANVVRQRPQDRLSGMHGVVFRVGCAL